MPPAILFDISDIDINRVQWDAEGVKQAIPQRGDMLHLDSVTYLNRQEGRLIGFKDVRDDEFWVPGHIPGRPLLPGVIMLELAAQAASFYTYHGLDIHDFVGFGGLEDCRFRMQVQPGVRVHVLLQMTSHRRNRIECKIQGLVEGKFAYEAKIIGVVM